MKKSKQYASEILISVADSIGDENKSHFINKITDVLVELVFTELEYLRKQRNVKTDSGIIAIFKEQRNKFIAICKIVNKVKNNLLTVEDFDLAVKKIYTENIYEFYEKNVINS